MISNSCLWIVRKRKQILALCCLLTLSTHFYLQGIFDDLRALSYREFTYPLQVNITQLLADVRENKKMQVKAINALPFTFVQISRCMHNINLLVIVKSAINNFESRSVIRSTWGNAETIKRANAKLVFHVGQSNNYETEKHLLEEIGTYKDIVQSTFHDFYYNNTFKSIMGLKYAFQHCSRARYALFVDDDYFVSVPNAVHYLTHVNVKTRGLWMGYLCSNGQPDRRHWRYAGKWRISLREYPYRYWPPFLHGGAYLMSADLLEDFYIVSQYTKFLRMDDVYFGVIAKKLNVIATTNTDLFPKPDTKSSQFPVSDPRLKMAIASHRFGNSAEIKKIWEKIQQ